MAIKLLCNFLNRNVERCGEVVEVLTNVGESESYTTKDRYPKGLDRQSYKESIAIHRSFGKAEKDRGETSQDLKAYFIY